MNRFRRCQYPSQYFRHRGPRDFGICFALRQARKLTKEKYLGLILLPFQGNFFVFFPAESSLHIRTVMPMSNRFGLARSSCVEYCSPFLDGTNPAARNTLIVACGTVAFVMDHFKQELLRRVDLQAVIADVTIRKRSSNTLTEMRHSPVSDPESRRDECDLCQSMY
jgi:hypothetical protein